MTLHKSGNSPMHLNLGHIEKYLIYLNNRQAWSDRVESAKLCHPYLLSAAKCQSWSRGKDMASGSGPDLKGQFYYFTI